MFSSLCIVYGVKFLLLWPFKPLSCTAKVWLDCKHKKLL